VYLSPSLADVDDVDTIWSSLPKVRLHVDLQILRADMALSCEQHLHVLRGSIEYGWKVVGRHLRV